MRLPVTGLVTFAAVGVLTWVVAGGTDAGPPELPDSDRVDAIVASYGSGDHVWVADDARDVVSEADERELERQAAASDPPVYVAFARATYEDGTDGVIPTAEAIWWHFEKEAVYVYWSGPGDIHVETGEQNFEGYPSFDENGDPVRRVSELISTVDADELVDRESDDPNLWQGALLGALGGGVAWLCLGLPLAIYIGHRKRRA